MGHSRFETLFLKNPLIFGGFFLFACYIGCLWGDFMCRKKYLQGCCMAAFGLGLLVGNGLDHWFLCCFSGIGLIMFGFCMMWKK